MKRCMFLPVLCFFCFSCAPGILENLTYDEKDEILIEYLGAELLEYNSVGNEWVHSITLTADAAEYELSIDTPELVLETIEDTNILIKIVTTEEDDVYPDVGEAELTFDLNDVEDNQRTEKTVQVSVHEDHGPGAGGAAVWEYTFAVFKKVITAGIKTASLPRPR